MLEYARGDSHYLLYIFQRMYEELLAYTPAPISVPISSPDCPGLDCAGDAIAYAPEPAIPIREPTGEFLRQLLALCHAETLLMYEKKRLKTSWRQDQSLKKGLASLKRQQEEAVLRRTGQKISFALSAQQDCIVNRLYRYCSVPES